LKGNLELEYNNKTNTHLIFTPEKDGYQWEKLEIPDVLKADGERIFKVALDPEITRDVVKNVKVKKKVEKKSKLPFGKTKEEFVTVIQKRTVKEPVEINPKVIMTGWADTGSILAVKVKSGEDPQPEIIEFFTGKGVIAKNNELIAEYYGFVRRGENWVEIIPFKGKSWVVSLSKDRASAFLKIFANSQQDMAPSTESVVSSAVSLGISKEKIIDESVISRIIKETVSSGAFLENFPLTIDKNASFSISTSEDGAKGLLNIVKGSGSGKALKLNEVGEAIKKSGFSGLNFSKIKEDILTFYKGSDLEMIDYVLVEGKKPERGEEVTFSIKCEMLGLKEMNSHKEQTTNDYKKRKPNGIESLEDYPVDNCKNIGIIGKGETAAVFSSSKPGLPGKDIYGKILPGLPGIIPNLTILENLVREKDSLISKIDGYLDIYEEDGKTTLRVRPSTSEIVKLEISEDKMEAYLSITENNGTPVTEEEIKGKIVKFGIVKGLKEEFLKKAIEASNSGEVIQKLLIASGEAPVEPGTSSLNMKVEIANDNAVSIRSDGSADFKNQNRITSVAKDDLIAVILSPKTEARNGWDVTGVTIKAEEAAPSKIEIGNGIKKVEEDNGDISLIAETAGELIQDGEKLLINNIHMVKGDVDLKEGNIKSPGSVKIGGSVTQGFFVMSGGEVQIAGGVEAALVSASESIIIGQGIVGGGKAILRSKQNIEMAFAEQATLLAVGDIKIKNSCLRCKIKCNGKLHLIGDKGNLVGGDTKSTGGINVGNLGNNKGVKTEVSFGQNYLIQDRIELEEKEVEKLKIQIGKIDSIMHQLEKEGDNKELKTTRIQKLKFMKMIEKRGLRLFTLRERFEEHFESNITVRGTLYPGVILESHGRYHEITSEKKNLIINFNLQTGKIEEKPIKKES